MIRVVKPKAKFVSRISEVEDDDRCKIFYRKEDTAEIDIDKWHKRWGALNWGNVVSFGEYLEAIISE